MNSQAAAAFLSVGFRPFYLGAGAFAAFAVPLWAAAYLLGLQLPSVYPAYVWHIHEMMFGFAPAVIAGFLLTAVRNWTARPTPSGGALAALFGLWLAGRAAAFVGPGWLFAVVDALFLPCLALCLGLPIWQARNYRNVFVMVILAVLAGCNIMLHAAVLGLLPMNMLQTSVTLAADVILLLMVVIGGRVIPAFSANAVPGLKPKVWSLLEAGAIAVVLLIVLADLWGPAVPQAWFRMLLLVAAAIHLLRWAAWLPWRTLSNVLLLVLPLAYLWIPIHLLLRAVLDGVPGMLTGVAAHALLAGAMAALMLAMMTRSALGHTGRPLRARPADVVCFVCIHLAALTRIAGPLLTPEWTSGALLLSAFLWGAAFASFAVSYAPMLVRPRVDALPTGAVGTGN